MMSKQDHAWLPGEYVWPYVLGIKLDLNLLPNDWYHLDEGIEKNETRSEQSYIADKPDVTISTQNDIITSVSCHEYCYFKGQQLIGMEFTRFLLLFELDQNIQPDKNFGEIQLVDELQIIYSIDEIGAQIWTFNGIIRSVIAGIMYEDDDATIRLRPFRDQL